MKILRFNRGVSLEDLPNGTVSINDIQLDLADNASRYSPNEHWAVESRPAVDLSAIALESAWVGSTGKNPANRGVTDEYLEYAQNFDRFGIVEFYRSFLRSNDIQIKRAELGTVLDMAVCTHYLDLSKVPVILEIGAGYGRLAEGFLTAFDSGTIKYILVDSVPSSIYYSYEYLKRSFPDRKIGYFYNGDSLVHGYDAFVIPAWHYAKIKPMYIDLAINIASFQEMSDDTVDAYVELIDDQLVDGGFVYFSNSREYIARRQFSYPPNWLLIKKEKSPRGWTTDHPLEILQKTNTEQNIENMKKELTYQKYIVDTLIERNIEMKQKLKKMYKYCENLRVRLREASRNSAAGNTSDLS